MMPVCSQQMRPLADRNGERGPARTRGPTPNAISSAPPVSLDPSRIGADHVGDRGHAEGRDRREQAVADHRADACGQARPRIRAPPPAG